MTAIVFAALLGAAQSHQGYSAKPMHSSAISVTSSRYR